MPFMFARRLLSCALPFAVASAICQPVLAASADGTLDCTLGTKESALLKKAPKSVHRESKYVLVVTTTDGPLRFLNTPPNDDHSVAWRYCGYDARAKVHLIGKNDAGTGTGLLVFEEGGKLVPGGETVTFAPDRKSFVAAEDTGEMEGRDWLVRDIDGKLKWKGFAGIMRGKDEIVASFVAPKWNAEGELTTDLICKWAEKPSVRATLVRSLAGKWSWRMKGTCPAAPR